MLAALIVLVWTISAFIVADEFAVFVDLVEMPIGSLLVILFPYFYGNFLHSEYFHGGAKAWAAPVGFIEVIGWILLVASLVLSARRFA